MSTGLAGIIAGQSAISMVGHNDTGLHYRGYDIHDLVKHASFEAVAYLLIYGELPTLSELKKYQESLIITDAHRLNFHDVMTVLKFKPNWALMFYSGLAFSPLAVFAGLWGDSFLQTAYHITKPDAAMLTSFSFLGLAVGAPILGLVSDRLSNRFGVMVFGMVLSIVALLIALYSPFASRWIEGVALFLFGFGTGAFMIVFSVGKEVNALAMTATVAAFINTGDALIGTFTEPLLGKFLDIFGHGKMLHGIRYFSSQDYHISLLLLPLYLVGALLFLFSVKKIIQK